MLADVVVDPLVCVFLHSRSNSCSFAAYMELRTLVGFGVRHPGDAHGVFPVPLLQGLSQLSQVQSGSFHSGVLFLLI